MYNSPINIIYGQMQTQMEGDILRAVQQYDINVDKEELIRALNYDREQYNKGYADGQRDTIADMNFAEVVRCADCRCLDEATTRKEGRYLCARHGQWVFSFDFCSSGERRNNEN